MHFIEKVYHKIISIRITETRAVNFIFTISPWVTPIITAWLVYDATILQLHWSKLQAFVGAFIIELNGIFSVSMVTWLYKEKASSWLKLIAFAMVGIYSLAILILTIVLSAIPEYAGYAPALFVLLVLSSSTGLVLRSHHKSVLSDARAKRKAEREAEQETDTKATQTQPQAQPHADQQPQAATSQTDVARDKIAALFETKPDSKYWSSNKIGAVVGVTGSRVRNIVHKNGDGSWKL